MELIMPYAVIYDGNCNLCANFVSILENLDRGRLFAIYPCKIERLCSNLTLQLLIAK